MKQFISILCLTLALLSLTACQTTIAPLEERLRVHISNKSIGQSDLEPDLPSDNSSTSGEEELEEPEPNPTAGPLKPFTALGAPEKPSLISQPPFGDTAVTVAVDNMPLEEFIHYAFSEILEVNYIIDGKIKKKSLSNPVTMNLSSEISQQHFFELVIDMLTEHQIAVALKNEVYHLQRGVTEQDDTFGFGRDLADIPSVFGQVKQLVPIKYVEPQVLTAFLQKSSGINAQVSNNENMLIIQGSRDKVEKALAMIKVLDRPSMRSRHVEMVPVLHVTPKELADKIAEIIQQEGIPLTTSPGRSGLYISTLEHPSAILIFAAEQEWIDRVKYWSSLLDVPKPDTETPEEFYFLFYPENCKAEDLSDTLAQILSLKAQAAVPQKPKTKAQKAKARKKKKSTKNKAETTSFFSGEDSIVKWAVDQRNNVLIIYTTTARYNEIKSLLKKLDTMPAQVLIEATVAEVTLTDSLQYGLEWFLKGNGGTESNVIQTLGGLGLGSGGLDISMITDSQYFEVLINALAQEDLVKILQAPRLMVQDSKSASFVVGTEVPVLTSEATSSDVTSTDGSSSIIRSIQYRSTGVKLSVTPTVQAAGVVTLKIGQEVSEAQANNTSDISSPIILNRSISTEVVAADGQTVLLAGLIKENNSGGNTKVPILGDLPILGHLFRTDSIAGDRTELVIMIKAHILRDVQRHDEIINTLLNNFEHIIIEDDSEAAIPTR